MMSHFKRFGASMAESLGAGGATPSGPLAAPPASARDVGRTRAREAGHMEIGNIVPDPNQPRKTFDAASLTRLATSMRSHGQLQPVRVRWREDLGKWMLLSGEYRWRAAQLAGLRTLACIFVDRDLTAAEMLEERLIENRFRTEMPPIEEAQGFRDLMDQRQWDQIQLAHFLGVSQGTVSKCLSLLEQPPEVQALVEAGEVFPTEAYEAKKMPPKQAVNFLKERAARRQASKKIGGQRIVPSRRIFLCGDLKVEVICPKRKASEPEEIAALEDALLQAMAQRSAA